MSTSKTGFIVSSFDIMGVLATPTLSYMGLRFNKCKIIALCGFFYVTGAIIYTLPYFFSPHYMVTVDGGGVLTPGNLTTPTNYTIVHTLDSTVDMCKSTTSFSTMTPTKSPSIFTLPPPPAALRLGGGDNNSTVNGTMKNMTAAKHSTVCNRTSTNSAVAWTYPMFIIAQLFMSIGSAPLFSLGITYLTDNVEEKRHALFTGK